MKSAGPALWSSSVADLLAAARETSRQLERQQVRTLIRQAQIEKDTPNTPPKACREIFQFWSDLAQSADSAEQSVPKNSESSQDA
jgi:hypothetical protein